MGRKFLILFLDGSVKWLGSVVERLFLLLKLLMRFFIVIIIRSFFWNSVDSLFGGLIFKEFLGIIFSGL